MTVLPPNQQSQRPGQSSISPFQFSSIMAEEVENIVGHEDATGGEVGTLLA